MAEYSHGSLWRNCTGDRSSHLWPLAESYRWMSALSRLGWAWEFLRRNPAYIDAFNTVAGATDGSAADSDKRAPIWSLLRFEDPALDARHANVFWLLEACREVLPLTASPMRRGSEANTLRVSDLQCRTIVYSYGEDERRDVLFAQEGRFLQLAIFGNTPMKEALLLTPALAVQPLSRQAPVGGPSPHRSRGTSRDAASLYPRERRAPRLMRVAQALDGWLAEGVLSRYRRRTVRHRARRARLA